MEMLRKALYEDQVPIPKGTKENDSMLQSCKGIAFGTPPQQQCGIHGSLVDSIACSQIQSVGDSFAWDLAT